MSVVVSVLEATHLSAHAIASSQRELLQVLAVASDPAQRGRRQSGCIDEAQGAQAAAAASQHLAQRACAQGTRATHHAHLFVFHIM